jgi:hypothetical protein
VVFDFGVLTALKASGGSSKYFGKGRHSPHPKLVPEAVEFEMEATSSNSNSLLIKYADLETLVVGVLDIKAGTLEGKLYQGLKLTDKISTKEDGSISLKKNGLLAAVPLPAAPAAQSPSASPSSALSAPSAPASVGNRVLSGLAPSSWSGSLKFADLNLDYAVDLDSMAIAAAGKFVGTGKHTVKGSGSTANMIQEVLTFDIRAGGVSVNKRGDSATIKFADAEDLMVGVLNTKTNSLEGKLYQVCTLTIHSP